jgi:hypothetical protein
MFFKIYGERNSGTNFLIKLIKKNFGNTYGDSEGQKRIDNKYYFWKHGIPKNDTKNNKENKVVVKLFIFRRLEPWLVSMFHNPYHLTGIDTFDTLLNVKFTDEYIEKRDENVYLHNNKIINFEDRNKTIFDIRYYKIQKIKEYCQANENIVILNLEYLQKDENCLKFLKDLNDIYKLGKKTFSLVEKHTKDKSDVKNKVYDTNYHDYQETIDKYKNESIENEINNLTYYIKNTKPKIDFNKYKKEQLNKLNKLKLKYLKL